MFVIKINKGYNHELCQHDAKALPVNMVQSLRSLVMGGYAAPLASRRGTHVKLVPLLPGTPLAPIQVGQPLYFNQDETLNQSKVEGIYLITVNDVASFNVLNRDPVATAQLANGYITFVDKQNNQYAQQPLLNLTRNNNNAQILSTDWPNLNWGGCYVTLNNTTGFNTTSGLFFMVYFTPNN